MCMGIKSLGEYMYTEGESNKKFEIIIPYLTFEFFIQYSHKMKEDDMSKECNTNWSGKKCAQNFERKGTVT